MGDPKITIELVGISNIPGRVPGEAPIIQQEVARDTRIVTALPSYGDRLELTPGGTHGTDNWVVYIGPHWEIEDPNKAGSNDLPVVYRMAWEDVDAAAKVLALRSHFGWSGE